MRFPVWFGLMGLSVMAAAQTPWQAVTFSMEPRVPGASPWEIRVDRSGVGRYRVLVADAAPATPLKIGEGTLQRLGRGQAKVATGDCETRLKHIARTGPKTAAYETAAGVASCRFDYSDDEGLMEMSAAMLAMVSTLQFGERLQRERRFDRLSLDAEMQSLTAEVQAGRAIEVGNIGATLQGLVEDDRVIDRVRRAAARLLEGQVVVSK